MSGYRTYIQGRNAIYYDKDFLDSLRSSFRLYRSNWRVLHIDGFEPPSWADPKWLPAKYNTHLSAQKRVFFKYDLEPTK